MKTNVLLFLLLFFYSCSSLKKDDSSTETAEQRFDNQQLFETPGSLLK